MATGQATVLKALDQLRATLTPEDNHTFSNATSADIWREARKIEKEQASRLDLRFMRRIEPYLRSLEAYSGVLEVFCQGYTPMAFVWGPIKLMLQLASQYTGVMDTILQAFNDIADVLPRVDRLRATFRDKADLDRVIGLIYTDIIEFHQRSYKFFRCRGWHFWFTFNWGLFERRFKSILNRLASHCDLLDKEAAAIHFSEMRDFRERRQFEEDAFEQRRQDQMAESVLRWLSAGEDQQEEHLHRISDVRQPQTCNWVLDDAQIQPWIEDESGDPVVWMTGIPGAGKSHLCSLIVQNLQTSGDRSALYYFCGKYSGGVDTCAIVLRTLAIQFLRQNPALIPLVHQAYFQKSSRSSLIIKKMMSEIIPTANVTRIVVDGIDEGSHEAQKEILKGLVEILKQAKSNCKLLVSSREEPQIQNALLPKTHMRLGDKTAKGLDLYITGKVNELKSCFLEMDPALAKLVEERLRDKAKGMFLWVRLVVTMLTQQMSELELEQAVDQLPDGLNEAYGRILSRIASEVSVVRDRAFRVLFWVCLAYRPVSIHEIADGIALHPNQRELSAKARSKNFRKDIVDLCAPLLEHSSSGILDLVHFSAKEYLLDAQSGPFIDTAKAHLDIAFSCIINLTTSLDLIPGSRNAGTEIEIENRVLKGHFGLHSYGHEFWAEHTVAFLEKIEDTNTEIRKLRSTLDGLLHACKHPLDYSTLLPPRSAKADKDPSGLFKLRQHPFHHNMISGWLQFQSLLRNARPSLDTVDGQQQYKLRTDVTYFSLIESRLNDITDKILMMSPSNLPMHIPTSDHKIFVSRFGLACRFFDCHHHFKSLQDRDSHEASHMTSFPCLQCDFAGRGFRSRKDLEKHIQKYHMSPEDFAIPKDLFSASKHPGGSDSNLGHGSYGASSCWNEKGRNAIQSSFRQVLAEIEPRVIPEASENLEGDGTHSIQSIRNKIDTHKYENLTDFKVDLRLMSSRTEIDPTERDDISLLYDEQIQRAVSEFPSFANLSHHDSPSNSLDGTLDIRHPKSLDTLEAYQENKQSTSLHASLLTRQRPYWSSTEKLGIPQLLERWGRNFTLIADYLKTKTADDVALYLEDLLRDGECGLSELADRADAKLQQDLHHTKSNLNAAGAEEQGLILDGTTIASDEHFQYAPPDAELHLLHSNESSSSNLAPMHLFQDDTVHQAPMITEVDQTPRERKVYKRKPRPREPCPHCGSELHDGSIKKHVERFHTATRKIWVCEDVSIDKRFFARCKYCTSSKRYNSEVHATNHLRHVHFDTQTSVETLQRWVREIEEPNPNFQDPSSEPRPRHQRNRKRQKTEVKPLSLPPLNLDPEISESPNPLPRMKVQPDDDGMVSDISNPEAPMSSDSHPSKKDDKKSSGPIPLEDHLRKENALLADVSFDNMLSYRDADTAPADNEGPPHQVDRTLIKPDQVSRLPHLDMGRRTICQDQVEALHRRLDKETAGSWSYREELENLTSLSRTLMSDLRDWRQHSTFAPGIPFSI